MRNRAVFISCGDFPKAARSFGAPDDGISLAAFLRTGWVGSTRYFFRSEKYLIRDAAACPDAWDELVALNEIRSRWRRLLLLCPQPSRRGRKRQDEIPIERYKAAFAMLRADGKTHDTAIADIASALGREVEAIRRYIYRRGANSA